MPLSLLPSPALDGVQPWTLGGGIVLASLVLEDAALVLAAVMATLGMLPIAMAWCAAFFGMFAGDMAIFWLARRATARIGRFALRQAPTTTELVIARFSPGLRTLAWGWSGAARMPAGRFARIVFLAGLAWTALVFSLVYLLGEAATRWLGIYTWFAVPLVMGWFAWRLRRRVGHSYSAGEPVHG